VRLIGSQYVVVYGCLISSPPSFVCHEMDYMLRCKSHRVHVAHFQSSRVEHRPSRETLFILLRDSVCFGDFRTVEESVVEETEVPHGVLVFRPRIQDELDAVVVRGTPDVEEHLRVGDGSDPTMF
jgi:hypothetical protein